MIQGTVNTIHSTIQYTRHQQCVASAEYAMNMQGAIIRQVNRTILDRLTDINLTELFTY